MAEKADLDHLIESYKQTAQYLEEVKRSGDSTKIAEVTDKFRAQSVCCNACQSVSSVCIPVAPNKCQGGCTVISVAI
jgi:hypothetical protein